jgi:hypothetical protein
MFDPGGDMFTVHISMRKKFIEIPLSTRGLLLSVLLVFSTVALAGPRNKPGQRYTIFDAPNATYTQAGNINDAGTVTGYFFDASRRIHGFLRDVDGELIVIDATPDAMDTEPAGINARGEIAGVAEGGAFIRDKKGDISLFSAPNATGTFVSGINARGDIAGMFKGKTDGGNHGYVRDSRGHITTFDIPNGSDLGVSGITARGDIVGTFEDWTQGGRQRIYLRDRKGSFTFLDIPNGTPWVAGLNDREDIAGISVNEGSIVGFVRDRDGEIIYLKVSSPEVTGINDRGDVVGIFGDPSRGGKTCGFVADSNGNITILDVPNATATYAYSINNRGEVSGSFDVAGLGSKRRGFLFRQD